MIPLKINYSLANDHSDLIIERIDSRIASLKKNGFILNKKRYKPNKKVIKFLDFLLTNNAIKELILLSPEHFQAVSINYFNLFPDLKIDKSLIFKFCKNLFVDTAYSRYINKADHIRNIVNDVCPYCNRSYITILSREGKIKPQIDHFYPTSIYPFFAVSYFNLIPSCSTCNGLEVKNNNDPNDFDLINPYLLNHSDFIFTYIPLQGKFATSPFDSNVIKVKFRASKEGHLKLFKLEELYNTHLDHVAELIFKSKIKYGKGFRKVLKNFPKLNLTDSDIDRFVLGSYSKDEDLHKRPLSKLYRDIAKELGLIK